MALVLNGSNDTITGLQINSANIVDGSIVNADINASAAIASTKLSGITAGITEADQWRVSSSFDVNGSSFISSNWERVDITGWDKIGTGMSESSGIFTFPTTGIYNVIFWDTVRPVNNTTMYAGVEFHFTTDNNTYTNYADVYDSVSSSTYFSAISGQQIFDITNVSTHKLKFKVSSEQTATFQGDTTTTQLSATFIRLGDT